MKILYLDCGMGAAGDMLAAALWELLDDREAFLEEFAALPLPGVIMKPETVVQCGIVGTHMSVQIHGATEDSCHHHHGHTAHTALPDIEKLIATLAIAPKVQETIRCVYGEIAAAEAHVHGTTPEQIHFHEVGTLDAIADITAVCMLLDHLQPDQIVASPVRVGHGQVHCAHGWLPIPAPAAAQLLLGVPTFGGTWEGEFCTPTGAAILKTMVSQYGPQPPMRVNRLGYGMGKRSYPAANCVRAIWGVL